MIEEYAKELKNQCVEMLVDNVVSLAREVETTGLGSRYIGVHGTLRWGLVHADLSQIVVEIQEEYYRRLNVYATEVKPRMQREHRETNQGLYPGQIGYSRSGVESPKKQEEVEGACIT